MNDQCLKEMATAVTIYRLCVHGDMTNARPVDVGVGEVAAGKSQAVEWSRHGRQDHSEVVCEVVVTEVQAGKVRQTGQETDEPAEAASVTSRSDPVEDVQ